MPQVGLILCESDYKGISIQGHRLKDIFDRYIPEHELEIYPIPFGSAAHQVDKNFDTNVSLIDFVNNKDYIISIELFLKNTFDYCRRAKVKTIWIPNKEWVPIDKGTTDKFSEVDIIMPTTYYCAEFMKSQFNLKNIVHNQLAFDLPIRKSECDEKFTALIFNAGLRGVGDRRNAAFVCEVMKEVLNKKRDIVFCLKSIKDIPEVKNLKKFEENEQFGYICQKADIKTNIEAYSLCDFSLVPSKWEGNGFAIIESLHMGTPVLTVDAPPMNEWVVHKETGYLCPCEYVDVNLPLPLTGERTQGVGWQKAVHTTKGEMKKGIYWLADNKEKIYKRFNEINKPILEERKNQFIQTWKDVLNGC